MSSRRKAERQSVSRLAKEGRERYDRGMAELDSWVFDVEEISAGVYRAEGRTWRGVRVECTGTDPGALLEQCRRDALALYKKPKK